MSRPLTFFSVGLQSIQAYEKQSLLSKWLFFNQIYSIILSNIHVNHDFRLHNKMVQHSKTWKNFPIWFHYTRLLHSVWNASATRIQWRLRYFPCGYFRSECCIGGNSMVASLRELFPCTHPWTSSMSLDRPQVPFLKDPGMTRSRLPTGNRI